VHLITRFHWTLEERTQARFDAARENNYLEHISNRAIGYEIEQIAHEDDPLAVMKAFEKEGWMKTLFPSWTTAKVDAAGLADMQKTRQQLADIGVQSDPAAARMYFLTRKMPEKEVTAMQKLLPRHHFVEQWRNIEEDAKDLAKQLTSKEYAAPSATWKLLMSVRPELIIFLDITTRQAAVEQKIKAFLTKWPEYRQKMPLIKMAEMRIKPDLPVYQKLLDEMFLMMLDSKLKTEAEIVKYLEPHQPPLPVAPPTPARRGRAKKKAVVAAAAPPVAVAEIAAPADLTKKAAVAAALGRAEKGVAKAPAAPAKNISAKKNEAPAKPVPASPAKKASSKPQPVKKAAKSEPKPKPKTKKPSKPQKKAAAKKKK
jgi:tRNA nucleotidyltransferase (CCA-adding enzyme)